MKYAAYYKELVDYLRRRHIRGGYGWPGKPVGAPAVTLYPNIAAELCAKGWMKTMAEFAKVSPDIMAAVIESGEMLTGQERWSLAQKWEGRVPGYLSAPVLQIVDPDTNKGKRRRRELADLINAAAELPDPVEDAYGLHTYWKRKALSVYEDLKKGNPCTFADWWWACQAVKDALEAEASKRKRFRFRTERIATA